MSTLRVDNIKSRTGSAVSFPNTGIYASGIVTATGFDGNLLSGGFGNFNNLSVSGVSTFLNGPLLIGAGTSTGTANQRFQVSGGAYISNSVGIGTSIPTQNLDVLGNVRVRGGLYDGINNSSGLNLQVPIADGNGGWSWQIITNAGAGTLSGIEIRDQGNVVGTSGSITTLDFRCDNTDNIVVTGSAGGSISTITLSNNPTFATVISTTIGIGITNPTQALDVVGNINASGTITANSDQTLKENIKTIPDALAKVLSLRGVEYDKIDNGDHQIGVIAQEVEKIIPEVVYPKGEHPDYEKKSVAYANLVGLLIEAIKEQNQRIDELERRLGDL